MTVWSIGARLRDLTIHHRGRNTLLFAGPAFAVSIGYVDPGNWATDLAAGRYGTALLWSVVLAGAMAIVVQVLVVRLTVATGASFGAMIARTWPKQRIAFFLISQGAAMATDLAEFTGIVVGLQLLFRMDRVPAAALAVAIVVLLLAVGNAGLRRLEVVLMAVLAIIAVGYVYEVSLFHPAAFVVLHDAFVPRIPQPAALTIVVGIIGATVMPHNLFLHSTFIMDRAGSNGWKSTATTIRGFSGETLVALAIATVVNAAILIVGASIGAAGGSIQGAYHTIAPVAGAAAAGVFGATLLCSGVAASTTATIAGDAIVKDLSPMQVARGVRRAVTLCPAVLLILAGANASALLIWSQVALTIALPAAVIPLVVLSARRDIMKHFTPSPALLSAAAITAALCILFGAALLFTA